MQQHWAHLEGCGVRGRRREEGEEGEEEEGEEEGREGENTCMLLKSTSGRSTMTHLQIVFA
jgi:hypothetical protein